MLAAGRLADIFGARLVSIGLVTFGISAALPALAHSVAALAALLALVGVTTGMLDIAVNSEAARIEAAHRARLPSPRADEHARDDRTRFAPAAYG